MLLGSLLLLLSLGLLALVQLLDGLDLVGVVGFTCLLSLESQYIGQAKRRLYHRAEKDSRCS